MGPSAGWRWAHTIAKRCALMCSGEVAAHEPRQSQGGGCEAAVGAKPLSKELGHGLNRANNLGDFLGNLTLSHAIVGTIDGFENI